ncbi:MAG: DUF192 domain-containing protein [Hyphomicrobiaceae bacterium]|nr:DUF192 domain-containing protein [Hyphomicrobiaceae bacterium]
MANDIIVRVTQRVALISFQVAAGAALCLAVIMTCALMLASRPVHAAGPEREALTIATVDGRRIDFTVEVARTPQQKSFGLMFRERLAPGTGMLFPYPAADNVTMWMRNTLISLDMLFIASDGRIARIEAHTEPMSERIISAGEPVTGVLEIAAGEASRLGIAAGDTVIHSHFKAR